MDAEECLIASQSTDAVQRVLPEPGHPSLPEFSGYYPAAAGGENSGDGAVTPLPGVQKGDC